MDGSARVGILPGVLEQVPQGARQGLAIGAYRRQPFFDLAGHLSPLRQRLMAKLVDNAPDHPVDFGRFELPAVGFGLHAPETEQALDHAVETLGFVRKQLVVMRLPLFARHSPRLEQFREMTHRGQRRPEFVRHGCNEVGLLPCECELSRRCPVQGICGRDDRPERQEEADHKHATARPAGVVVPREGCMKNERQVRVTGTQ